MSMVTWCILARNKKIKIKQNLRLEEHGHLVHTGAQ
jgi:hypothetical protein